MLPYLDLLGQKGRFKVRLDNDLHLHLLSTNLSNKGDYSKWQADVLSCPIPERVTLKTLNFHVKKRNIHDNLLNT